MDRVCEFLNLDFKGNEIATSPTLGFKVVEYYLNIR